MKKFSLMYTLFLASLTLNSVMASVTVTIQKEQYVFEHEPRLVEVLALATNQKNWYWPSVSLYQANNVQLEETRQLLLESLNSLINHYQTGDTKTALSIERLHTTIKRWRLARRLPIKIDYELARLNADANPLITKGRYILDLTPRINTIQLFGAVNKTSTIPHLPHADASEYMTNQNLTSLADKDNVIIIQADGREIITPIAYWNKAHQELMPGSQLFVPFKQTLFHPKFAIINKQITTLALNRLR
jgi:hypothetical protein